MELGAATHFGQGWSVDLLKTADKIGVSSVRDAIYWSGVETSRGVYDFSGVSRSYVDAVLASGDTLTLGFGMTNPLYDGGFTPYTDEGRQAFAKFVVATLDRFPDVTTIEIGNEFFGSFVTGPIASASWSQRAEYYVEILRAVYDQVQLTHPDVQIIGGATHSIPVDYFEELFSLGALDMMDGITIHPYTTPPEQLADQLALLRQAMGAQQLPIYVTEFGQAFTDAADAPAYLVKMVSVMAANDVASADWYALAEQKWYPNMELISRTGEATAAGKSFALLQQLLGSGDVTDVSPDAGVYAFRFGDNAVVMWGESRQITVSGDVRFFDAQGNELTDFDGRLGDEPVIMISATPLPSGAVDFVSERTVLADSYHDFDASNDAGGTSGFEGPWSYFSLSGAGKLEALYTMGGGYKGGEAWTPYIGSTYLRPLSVTASSLVPADFGAGTKPSASYSVVERFTASTDGKVDIVGHWDVSDTSKDGVELTVKVNGVVIHHALINDPGNGYVYDLALSSISLHAGDKVDFIVGKNITVSGDRTARSIQIIAHVDTAPAKVAPANLLIKATDANDLITGGAGNDSVSYASSAARVTINLATTGAQNTVGSGMDTISAVENVIGSAFNDMLFGNAGANRLVGADGNDLLDGKAGADSLEGGAGHDIFYVDAEDVIIELDGNGTDIAYARADYTLAATASIERLIGLSATGSILIGNDFNNEIRGNAGNDVIRGLGGNDGIYGGAGHDTNYGGAGDDVIRGEAGNDALYGDDGNDILDGGDGDDVLEGGAGNDALNGGSGANILRGGDGNDIYMIAGQKDVVQEAFATNGGTDTIVTTGSYILSDAIAVETLTVSGTAGLAITGNLFANRLNGGVGNDVLNGAGGADAIYGGAGNDVIIGGAGRDMLRGEAGADRFVFNAITDSMPGLSNADAIADFSRVQGDRIDLSGIDAIAGGLDDSFALVSAFTRTAGQLTVTQVGGGYYIQGDVNGDGLADFGIAVTSALPLLGSDFIL